ncbi:hypothetical protein KL949_000004 [Ogataea haglerorum]|nr:hypothetical protein KL914_000768 [Ogataea haglerorum]KAG7722947.1 hypothetical protein KL913_000767 [Ogataea haglerorum]KAG7722954.1 hypothetical protein KL949_000004 [Ogataea haglerorum]
MQAGISDRILLEEQNSSWQTTQKVKLRLNSATLPKDMGPATFIRPGRYPLANNVTSTQTACLTRMWPERQRRAKKERNGGNDAGRRADDVLTEEQQQHHMVRMRSHQVG